MEREDLPDLLVFSIIIEERSFRGAATKLGISASAVSHTMRRLEAKLGTALLRRTTRSVAPTEAGAELMRRLKPAFDEIDLGLLDLAGRTGRIAGRVKINTHRNAAELLIMPKLCRLNQDYPELRIELSLDDTITDIVAAGCDAGIRNGEKLVKDMIAVRISGDHESAVVAAPSYLNARPKIKSPEDLSAHCCIGYRHVTSRLMHRWRFKQQDRELEVSFDPCLIVDDIHAVRAAAMQGIGLGYVSRDSVQEHLDSGRLVEVLRDWSITLGGDFLYYPSRRTLSPAMRVIVDRLRLR